MKHRHLLTGSAWLVVTFGVNGLSGAVYWLVASHLYDKTQVGVASALVSSIVFLAFAAGLGLPLTLARFGHQPDEAAKLLRAAAAVSAVASAVASIVYLLVIDAPATRALSRLGGIGAVSTVALLVTGACFAMLVDVRLIIDRRWAWVVARVVGAAVLRFPILMLLPRHHAEVWLLLANAGPVALSGFIGIAALGRRSRAAPGRERIREMVHFSVVNYAATLVSGAAIFVLPIIVLVSVTPSANANFYIAWGVVALTALLPAAIGQVLLVEGGRPDESTDHVAVAALVAVGLMAAVAAVVFLAKGMVVTVYGPDYRLAARILPGLVLAGIPAAAGTILLTEARLRRDAVATVAMPAAASVTVLGLAFVLVPRMGVDGAVAAWLFGNIVGLAVALLVRRYRIARTAGETAREPASLVSTRSM